MFKVGDEVYVIDDSLNKGRFTGLVGYVVDGREVGESWIYEPGKRYAIAFKYTDVEDRKHLGCIYHKALSFNDEKYVLSHRVILHENLSYASKRSLIKAKMKNLI